MNIHGRGSCKPFYRHKMVFTIKWLDTAYKMSGPNPNEDTIFWGGLAPEHLELEPQNLYKTIGSLSKWSRHKSTDFSTSLRIIPFSHSFILFPMPPSANPGLSTGHFGIVWATWFPSAATTKKASLNLSTHHEIGDWDSICHPFAFLDFASNASKCQPWPFNVPFWNSVGYLYDPQVPPL